MLYTNTPFCLYFDLATTGKISAGIAIGNLGGEAYKYHGVMKSGKIKVVEKKS